MCIKVVIILNTRIKQVREDFELTQEEFGKRIGSARNTIANYENGNRTPGRSIILSICREFGVNEDWLVNGTGGPDNMYIPEDLKYIQNMGKLGNEKNEFKKFYLNTMMGLPDDFWDYIYKEFKKFSDKKEGE